jgi:uncharacterized protein
MERPTSDIAFTPSVKSVQSAKGSRDNYARMEASGGWETTVTPRLTSFLKDLDMFYLGTSNADGQPYIQYRGGSPGFLKAIDAQTLAWAEFGGNRQFISFGNLEDNPKAFIFLMDYENSRRIKIWGRAKVVEDDPELMASLSDPDYDAEVQRAVVFTIEAWDVNCPQHIHKRVLVSEVEPIVADLKGQIAELKDKLAAYETSVVPAS